jgi:D-serine dehydratase
MNKDVRAMNTSAHARLDGRTKGLPAGTPPLSRDDIARAGWNVLREDLPLPLAVLKESSLAHNAQWMNAFRAMTGVEIAPHGKTSMSPELYARQLADGAWGITVATVQQLRVCREHGIRRVVLANQLVGRQAIRYVRDELARDPQFEFCCLVDSVAGVELLLKSGKSGPGSNFANGNSDPAGPAAKFEPGPSRSLGPSHPAGPSRPIDVLLECGAIGARTGCRTLDQALAVARRVAAAKPYLRLIGIEGFEGAIHGATPAETEARIAAFVAFIGEVAAACSAENLIDADPIILSAGGSAYFDIVTKLPREFNGRRAQVLIRSGCYLTHDSDSYAKAAARMRERMPEIAALGPGLRDALEVWSYVQSLPEPGLAILTMGKRDVSYDQHLPFPRLAFRPGADAVPRALPDGYAITALNDQHAFMKIPPNAGLHVGDMIGCTIAHPCTTFDKWRFMVIVDDDYNVIDSITTFF